MINKKVNVFQAVAEELVNSNMPELWFVAGIDFDMPNASKKMNEIFVAARQRVGWSTAAAEIVSEYQSGSNMQMSHEILVDWVWGSIQIKEDIVGFAVRRIEIAPSRFLLLFKNLKDENSKDNLATELNEIALKLNFTFRISQDT